MYGEIIRKIRIDSEMSVYRLSKMTGVHESTIGRIERGDCVPSVEVYDRLLGAFGKKIGIVQADQPAL